MTAASALHRDILSTPKLPKKRKHKDVFACVWGTVEIIDDHPPRLAQEWAAFNAIIRAPMPLMLPAPKIAGLLPAFITTPIIEQNRVDPPLFSIKSHSANKSERQRVVMGTLRCASCNGFCKFTVYAPATMLDWVTFKASVYGMVKKTGADYIEVQIARTDVTHARQQLREALEHPNAVEVHMARSAA